MKITVGQLRALVREAKIGASKDYMKKELVRERLQAQIAAAVAQGVITDDASLQSFMAQIPRGPDVELALTALRAIPFEIWRKLAAA